MEAPLKNAIKLSCDKLLRSVLLISNIQGINEIHEGTFQLLFNNPCWEKEKFQHEL